MSLRTGVIREVRGDIIFVFALFRGLLVGNTLKVCWTERQADFAEELARRKLRVIEREEGEDIVG